MTSVKDTRLLAMAPFLLMLQGCVFVPFWLHSRLLGTPRTDIPTPRVLQDGSTAIVHQPQLSETPPVLLNKKQQKKKVIRKRISKSSYLPSNFSSWPMVLNPSTQIYKVGSWDGPPVVLENYKLLFFTQPTVGCNCCCPRTRLVGNEFSVCLCCWLFCLVRTGLLE